MRAKLAVSPWWVQGLVYGVLFGTFMTVFRRLDGGHWLPDLIAGALGGAFYGVLMGLFMSRLNRRLRAGLADLAPPERREVARATWRGPAPREERLRAQAWELVRRRRDEAVRTRRRSALIFVGFITLYVVLALTQTSWWWLGAALFAGLLMMTVAEPARLARRLAVLDEQAPTSSGSRPAGSP